MICTSSESGLLDLSAEQQGTVDAITAWREAWPGTSQTLSLGGLAGTGKKTVVTNLAQTLPGAIVCPTGKAANVLRKKGVDAKTIHSQIYEPRTVKGNVVYLLKWSIDAETLIIDEASMVNSKLYGDLCTFTIPILFVGDHGQLEPVGENPNLMLNPDLRLETIHRQALDNPIIRLAAAFREGREGQVRNAAKSGLYRDPSGRCIVTSKARFDDYLFSGMQVLVGFNKTRHDLNKRIRAHLGFKGPPLPEEKLICLQNNSKFNVYNGQEFVIKEVYGERSGIIELEMETDDGRQIVAPAWHASSAMMQ
jgi:ATP-dependent exoDNAse (exonuclease V) alpha subunit